MQQIDHLDYPKWIASQCVMKITVQLPGLYHMNYKDVEAYVNNISVFPPYPWVPDGFTKESS